MGLQPAGSVQGLPSRNLDANLRARIGRANNIDVDIGMDRRCGSLHRRCRHRPIRGHTGRAGVCIGDAGPARRKSRSITQACMMMMQAATALQLWGCMVDARTCIDWRVVHTRTFAVDHADSCTNQCRSKVWKRTCTVDTGICGGSCRPAGPRCRDAHRR
jgi:hypothetical protein